MKVYNKFVESKKEPYNKNDIWFDGSVANIYKEGKWQAFTLELDAANKVKQIIDNASNVYQEKLTAGEGISIKNNVISTDIEVPTPDWNASERKSGYIKNKTHYIDYGTLMEITINADAFDMWEEEDEYGDITRYARSKEMLNYYGTYDIVVKTIDNSYVQPKYNDTIISLSETGQYVLQDDDVEWYIKLEYAYDDSWGEGYNLLLSTQSHWTSVKFYLSDEYGVLVRPLQGYFIPNDIARQDLVDELREETTALWENLDHGTFPNLVAGDLAGRGESVSAEFGFRASGGKSIKDGRAYIKRIKGNSVVWNQWVDTIATQDCDLSETDNRLTLTPQGSFPGVKNAISMNIVENHVYICISHRIGGGFLNVNCGGQDVATNVPFRAGHGHYGFVVYSYDETQPFTITRPILIDLTKMFQAGNEPSTIEEFNARVATLGIDMYAYNEGQVIHCNTKSIKSVGDNAWDEQWRQGFYYEGEYISQDTQICSKNPIQVLPNESYRINQEQYYVWYYDKEMHYIGYDVKFNSETFVTPSNAAYIHFNLEPPYGVTYKNDIIVTLVHSDWKQGYQPYWQDTLPLPIIRKYFPDGMKSAGSAHDEIRFNKASGKWEKVQRIGSVDLGSFDYNLDSRFDNAQFYCDISLLINNNIRCGRYITIEGGWDTNKDKTITRTSGGQILIVDSAYTDAASFKASLQGVMLYYESTDWEWVELDAEDQNFRDYYQVADFGTEQSQSNVPSAPFSADIIYQFNAVDMIRENYNEIEKIKAALATIGITI